MTCLVIVSADFADLARDVTASIMSIVVFPGAIFESRNPCSSVDESVNSLASSSTDPLTESSKVLLVSSFEGELGREKSDDSSKGPNDGIPSGRHSGKLLGVDSGGPSVPEFTSKLVCEEEHADRSSVDESVAS